MLVVADATPLHYLVLIASTPILPALFGHILSPHAVAERLQHPQTLAEVRAWLTSPPPWLEIRLLGHAPATTPAQELQADLLLMDDG